MNLFNFSVFGVGGLNSIIVGLLIVAAVAAVYFWARKRGRASGSGTTSTLDRFSRDLTRAAQRGKLDALIGREEEVKRMIQILSRRTKNNAILVGEAGSGKTALAEGLASKIASRQVPLILQSKRVLALNLGGMLAGTQYRGEFEQRMKAITDEISAAGRSIILFIDEIQNLTQAGEATGAIGAANLLKPALARGDIQAIGACTIEDYYQYIINDASLERRFQPVLVKEATPDEAEKILLGIKSKYETHHNVAISEEIVKAIIDLCGQYMSDRYFPDKAIDVMDEAAAKAALEFLGQQNAGQPPAVSVKDIENVIFQWGSDLNELKKRGEFLKKGRQIQ